MSEARLPEITKDTLLVMRLPLEMGKFRGILNAVTNGYPDAVIAENDHYDGTWLVAIKRPKTNEEPTGTDTN